MIDENNYLKHRTICKICHNENRRKNNINTITKNEIDNTPQQHKSIKSSTKMFQHLKIELMLLLAQET